MTFYFTLIKYVLFPYISYKQYPHSKAVAIYDILRTFPTRNFRLILFKTKIYICTKEVYIITKQTTPVKLNIH